MKTINMKSLQKLIAANNGKLSTAVIADLLGKNHSDVKRKLGTQLTGQQFAEQLETYSKGHGAEGTRTIYLLPEAEAMALAMSYDMKIGMEVYAAFKAYEAALISVVNSESLAEAKTIANKALNVHGHMDIKKPLHRIRLFLAEFKDVTEGVTAYIKAMKGNPNASYCDRNRTLTSLTTCVNESYDNLSARNITAVIQHEAALKLIAREERYQARTNATRNKNKNMYLENVAAGYDF